MNKEMCPLAKQAQKSFAELNPELFQKYVLGLLTLEELTGKMGETNKAFDCPTGHKCMLPKPIVDNDVCENTREARKSTLETAANIESFSSWLKTIDPSAFGIIGGSFQWKKWRPEVAKKSDLDILLVVEDLSLCLKIPGIEIEHIKGALALCEDSQAEMVKLKIPWSDTGKSTDILSLHIVTKKTADLINQTEFLKSGTPLRCVRESKTEKTQYGPQITIKDGEKVMIPLNQAQVGEHFISEQLFFTTDKNSPKKNLIIGSLLDMILSSGGKSFGNHENAKEWTHKFTQKTIGIIKKEKLESEIDIPFDQLFTRANRMLPGYRKLLRKEYDRN